MRADAGADASAARELNAEALELIAAGKPAEAEAALKAALTADGRFGPAHNNLGHLHYVAGRLYEAAWEFESAAKLMPGDPAPHNNLGLVMEAAGRLPQAVEAYSVAVDMRPDRPEFLANLARVRVTTEENAAPDPATAALLRDVVLIDPRPAWTAWAGELLATRYLAYADALDAGPPVPLGTLPPDAGDVPGDEPVPPFPAPPPLPLDAVAPPALPEPTPPTLPSIAPPPPATPGVIDPFALPNLPADG